MMGYSVTEAASVLGVPTERVWELLARGVLVGEPEGEAGMRVFLQPRPAPAPVAHPDDTITARSNGPERELSPFRELLTEFRSLTERYGQALLALGEARGEVASLRSRVDMLEARIDLRLPMGPPTAAAWPTQPQPVAEPVPASGTDAAADHDEEHDDDAHRPRPRGARRAIEGFAEALARAEDPSLSDLAGAGDADALAAFRSEADATEAQAADSERILPREVMPAEPVLVAEEAPEVPSDAAEAVPTEEAEPPVEALERGEDTPQQADLPGIREEPEPAIVEPEPVPASEEPEAVDPWAEPVDALASPVDVGPEPVDAELEADEHEPVAIEPEPVDAEAEPATGERDVAPATADDAPTAIARDAEEVEPSAPPEAVAAEAEPTEFDTARYTTDIEQPDWYEAEADDDTRTAAEEEPVDDSADASATSEAAATAEPEAPVPPEDLGRWRAEDPAGDGAAEMEVAGGGQRPPSVPEAEPEAPAEADSALPGSRELDEALEAFGDLGGTWAAGRNDEWPPATASAGRIAPSSARSSNLGSARPPYAPPISTGPATRAYRRLRRIFPT